MIKAIVSDFSRVILLPKDNNFTDGLNALHKKLSDDGDYDFWSYFRLNQDLITFYKIIGKNLGVYIFTTGYVQEHPALQPELDGVFKGIFSSARLNLKKADIQSYLFVAKKIGLKPEEILYVDDKPANLAVAKEAGLEVVQYKSNEQVKADILKKIKL